MAGQGVGVGHDQAAGLGLAFIAATIVVGDGTAAIITAGVSAAQCIGSCLGLRPALLCLCQD